MRKINNEYEYNAVMARIEQLLPLTGDDVPKTDPNLVELDILSELVSDYEDVHYPVKSPSLPDIIKLRMYEMGLNQSSLASLLGVSPSRISDFLSGRSEPTLKTAREISRKLNIEPAIVLGV